MPRNTKGIGRTGSKHKNNAVADPDTQSTISEGVSGPPSNPVPQKTATAVDKVAAQTGPARQPFTLDAAQLRPRAHPYVYRVQLKHPCITSYYPLCPARTPHGPEHARTHEPNACAHPWLCTRLRAGLVTPVVQGDECQCYKHVLDESVALPPCSGSLLLLGMNRLDRDARLDARPCGA